MSNSLYPGVVSIRLNIGRIIRIHLGFSTRVGTGSSSAGSSISSAQLFSAAARFRASARFAGM